MEIYAEKLEKVNISPDEFLKKLEKRLLAHIAVSHDTAYSEHISKTINNIYCYTINGEFVRNLTEEETEIYESVKVLKKYVDKFNII